MYTEIYEYHRQGYSYVHTSPQSPILADILSMSLSFCTLRAQSISNLRYIKQEFKYDYCSFDSIMNSFLCKFKNYKW